MRFFRWAMRKWRAEWLRLPAGIMERRWRARRHGAGRRQLDAVLAPVSGGGLLSGTCLGAKGLSATVRVFGCEPEKADDAFRSLKSGELQALEESETIADGLRAALAPRTFAILREQVDGILLVSEEEIKSAMRLVWERMKIVVEPSSSIALAPWLNGENRAAMEATLGARRRPLKIGVIFSGGNVELG